MSRDTYRTAISKERIKASTAAEVVFSAKAKGGRTMQKVHRAIEWA
jgi:hypothetical protein